MTSHTSGEKSTRCGNTGCCSDLSITNTALFLWIRLTLVNTMTALFLWIRLTLVNTMTALFLWIRLMNSDDQDSIKKKRNHVHTPPRNHEKKKR
jgi:hypothetical protein